VADLQGWPTSQVLLSYQHVDNKKQSLAVPNKLGFWYFARKNNNKWRTCDFSRRTCE